MALARRFRTAPERVLHPLRRKDALRALRRVGWPRTILVVCHGNICRSPFAAGILSRSLGPGGTLVDSAGFIGPGRPVPAEGHTIAARRGIDLSTHRSRFLTPDLVQAAELIVVMEPGQRREICGRFGRLPREVIVLGDLDPARIETREIYDPVDQPLAAFEESYARIERCARALVEAVSQGIR